MNSKILVIFGLLCLSLSVQAQFPGGMPSGGAAGLQIGHVYGKVLEASEKTPIAYASVTLLTPGSDSAITGQFTRENGEFSLENLPIGSFKLKILYLGHTPMYRNVRISPMQAELDMGNLYLDVADKVLDEVNIRATKDQVQLGIDRKIFNVEKDIAAQNGTAVDALKNVPTLQVDNDGNAQLRGGTVQVFVDGKPTNLSLNQIPAAEIERVEVLSNASAKYDANATNGIVNLVMKKNTKPGINGMANLGIGTNNRYNAMTNLNIKEGRFNLSLSYNLNQARNINNGYTDRVNYAETGAISSIYQQDNTNTMQNRFQFGRLGLDYQLNNRNSLTLSQMFVDGRFKTDDPQSFSFKSGDGAVLSTGARSSKGENQFGFSTTELGFRHTFPKPDQVWSTSVQYGINKGNMDLNLANSSWDANGQAQIVNPAQQINDGSSKGKLGIFQTDLTLPLSNAGKLELGAKSQWRNSENDNDALLYNGSTEIWTKSDYLSTHYDYTEWINALYANYNHTLGSKWRYQAGLRFEHSYFKGGVEGTDSTFSYQYPQNLQNLQKALFPALYLSRSLSASSEMQLNFSRKLSRPNFFQMMPFVMVIDNQSYRTGNPNLQPEFVNTAEWNISKTVNKGSYLFTAYGKYIEQPITELTQPAEDGSTALLTTFINGSNSQSAGFEQTLKYTLLKGFTATANANVYYQSIQAAGLERAGWNWTGKINLDYKFANRWTLQVSGQYEGPRILTQGRQKRNYFSDAALRYEFSNMGSVSLSVSDMFNTKRMGSTTETAYFSQDQVRRRESRYVQLGVMLRFGKPDFSLLKKMKRGGEGAVQGGGGDYGY